MCGPSVARSAGMRSPMRSTRLPEKDGINLSGASGESCGDSRVSGNYRAAREITRGGGGVFGTKQLSLKTPAL